MFKLIKPYIPYWLLATLVGVFHIAIETAIYLKISEFIDQTIKFGNTDGFTRQVLYMLAMVAVLLPSLILGNYLRSGFVRKCIGSARRNYVRRLFAKNINEFQKENNAAYLSALTNDFEQVENNFLIPAAEILTLVVNFAAAVYLISVANPWILLIAAAVIVINFAVNFFVSRPLNRHNKERSAMFSGYTEYVKEVLSAFHIIKTHDLEKRVRDNFREKSRKIQNKGYLINKIISYTSATMQAILSFSSVGFYVAVAYLSIKGYTTLGGVILVLNAIEKLLWPVYAASDSIPKIFSVKSLYKKIEDSLVNRDEYPETRDYPGLENEITIRDLNFAYGGGEPVLAGVSLRFRKGGKYLLVGPSGGGKSTLLRLLRKYFLPQNGEILIDEIPLKDIRKDQYFANIANIEQNVFIFEDTARNNLTLYKEYDEADIERAIEMAGLKEFVSGLPEGLDTVIYDNGKNISGGERSRIAIARGLLNNAEIMFLDEPFANLDAETAAAIEKNILDLPGVTVINVSHVVFRENQDRYDGRYLVSEKKVTAI